MSKFIVITGGVLSSVGKGTIASSIGLLLTSMGLNVSAVKIDPYINVDAGTMNPYAHGEVFVTEDGVETDLDLGNYERYLNRNMHGYNNITTGKIYYKVINNEREGKYLGQTVQIIPHVTDEIKRSIYEVTKLDNADILLIEVGGTVGDIESLPFLEALRQMKLELERDKIMFIHVALVEYLKATGELKTKPLQHSLQELRRIGIQPDMIIARSEIPLDEEARGKISLHGNVRKDFVLSSYDVELPYEVPLMLEKQDITRKISSILGLEYRKPDLTSWVEFVNNIKFAREEVPIALVGKYTKLKDSYISIKEAIIHSAAKLKVKPKMKWIESTEVENGKIDLERELEGVKGVIILPGFGVRGVEGKIKAIKYARENNVPLLGICFGFQLSVVEYARNVLGLKEANSTEINPNTPHPVVTILDTMKQITRIGGTMRLGSRKILIRENSLAEKIYNSKEVFERHRHRYEVNPKYIDKLESAGLIISGVSEDGLAEFIELKKNKFFFGTQPHPEFNSRPNNPSPPYLAFLEASSK
jgi:CTP synthase